MFRRALDLVRRAVPQQSATPQPDRLPAATARQDRAETVLALQDDVRRLQHEIKDADDAGDGTDPGTDPAGAADRVAALEAELEEKQRELAKLQGRV